METHQNRPLKKANKLFREKKYSLALEEYKFIIQEKPELSIILEFNIEITQKKLLAKNKNQNEKKTEKELKEHIEKQAIELGIWDKEYYLEKNNDVKKSGKDAYNHFINYGWKEKRNPSKNFNTSFYISQASDLKNLNPIEHFITYGQHQKININDLEHKLFDLKNISKKINYKENLKLKTDLPIDIIVPVYNGFEYLKPLFESVYNHTTLPFRLLVADDCSPDSKVLPYLQSWSQKKDNFILIENKHNLGFVETVNKLSKITNNNFVLLNTDTEVPFGWLERLMYPIFKMEKIATTTPFTNSGTICSFPNYLEDNEIPEGLNVNNVDSYFKDLPLTKTYIEIPTGVGFCMGVNKKLVDKIGMFDPIFGLGYGEENDFCQRAIKLGYKNLHVPNLYIYHKHGGSFPYEKKLKLIEKNLKILNNRHPNYDKQIAKAINLDKLSPIRKSIDFKINSRSKKITLFFDHGLGGGASDYLSQRIKKLKEKEELSITVENNFEESILKIHFNHHDKTETIETNKVDGIVEFLLINFDIDEIFINSIVGYPNVQVLIDDILNYKSTQKLIIPLHDYYPICPSFTLLNDKGEYCGVPKNLDICAECIKNNDREFKKFTNDINIQQWRKSWKKILSSADEILTFSKASTDILLKAFQGIEDKIKLTPHNITGRFKKIYDEGNTKDQDSLTIGILGGINEAKGIYIIKELIEYVDANNLKIKIVVFGETSIEINAPCFKKTGRYEPQQLPSLIKSEGVSVFLIPSIWPETFSYTTDEVMQMGFPLAVFDLGAPAERVKNYSKGLILNNHKPQSMIKKLSSLH
jgi:GT2 family glycosyltransferase